MKMGNSSYSKIVGIGDVCIETNVGSTMMLKDVRHVPDLRMNVFSTLAMDRAGYCNYLGNGRWKLTKGSLVVARGHARCGLYRTHVKTCKKKSNEIKNFEKTPKVSVGINGVETKRVKFSLPDSSSEREVIGDEKYEDAKATWDDDELKDPRGLEQGEQYPPLKIVEPLEKRTSGKHHTVSFKNNWASDEGEPRDLIKEIQDEINYLRMKGIDVNEVFSLLVKIMKNVKPCFDLTSTKKN